jgi:cytosine/adenosine deaminase-related metal-dependent hydrolase
MILSNVHIVGESVKKNVHIKNGLISAVDDNSATTSTDEINIEFENAIAFPGLINSHDHLDFNSFPQLGNHIYKNYVDWGNDIHQQNKAVINSVLKIPKPLRVQWGVYKNLLNGVTTVVNHGEILDIPHAVINVFQNCYSLHSAKLESRWKYSLNKPFVKDKPFVIHIGEGTDIASKGEIDELLKWNLFKRKLIGIHGVAMDEKQATSFDALVWCPATNYFLLNKTADINQLKNKTTILFGTDSTLTASWNIWEHFRLARKLQMLDDIELYDSVTSTAASIWKLNNGLIEKDKTADIVIGKYKTNEININTFYSLNPEDILLILNKGSIIFFDESLLPQLKNVSIENYSKTFINNIGKYIIGNLPSLIKEIKKYNPGSFFPVEVE